MKWAARDSEVVQEPVDHVGSDETKSASLLSNASAKIDSDRLRMVWVAESCKDSFEFSSRPLSC